MASRFDISPTSSPSTNEIGHMLHRNIVIMQTPRQRAAPVNTAIAHDTAKRGARMKLEFRVYQNSTSPITDVRSSGKRHRDDTEMAKAIEIKKAIRREQCRINQARYRDRQRALQCGMGHAVQQLREEVKGLKLKRRRLRFDKKTTHSPWRIVIEVFHLIETSFSCPWNMTNADEMRKHSETRKILAELQESFLYDVRMGDLCGVDALLDQLRRYSLCFSDPKLHLQRVEEVVPGVVTATAQFSGTVSEFTLRCALPHLQRPEFENDDYEHGSLRKKLLGHRFHCSCKMTFLMDEDSGRVARVEMNVDWLTSLYQLLNDASKVSKVLNQVMFTRNCEIGTPTHGWSSW